MRTIVTTGTGITQQFGTNTQTVRMGIEVVGGKAAFSGDGCDEWIHSDDVKSLKEKLNKCAEALSGTYEWIREECRTDVSETQEQLAIINKALTEARY